MRRILVYSMRAEMGKWTIVLLNLSWKQAPGTTQNFCHLKSFSSMDLGGYKPIFVSGQVHNSESENKKHLIHTHLV